MTKRWLFAIVVLVGSCKSAASPPTEPPVVANDASPSLDPVAAEPATPEPAKPEPAKPEPAKPEPAKPDPAKPDPARPDPARPDPAKPNVRVAPSFADADIPEIDLQVTPGGPVIVTEVRPQFDPPTAPTVMNVLPTTPAKAPKRKFTREVEFGKWVDADKDCFDARHEVLKEESLIEAKWTKKGSKCSVTSGSWECPYSGKKFKTPKGVQIDHMVPLKNAWLSGAHRWTKAERVEYANFLDDEDHLVAVDGPSNAQKSDRSPDKWLPCNEEARCWYVAAWVKVKKKWELSATEEEIAALKIYRSQCKKGEVPDAPQASCP